MGKILLFKNYLKLSMNVLDVHLQIRLFGGPLTVQNCANHVIILEGMTQMKQKIRVQVGIRVSEGWGIYNVKWGKLWYQE